MCHDTRPLETLSAIALTFVSGMLASAALGVYAQWVRRQARAQAPGRAG